MIVFPNAKINLGLHITEKRSDGYHNIETCFVPVGWSDILEIIPSDYNTSINISGISIPDEPEKNLVLKAYQLLRKEYDLPAVSVHLHKVVPIGAGLGGGSSDASYALKALNRMFFLDISDDKLEQIASELGADCPFFVRNKPVIATGIGDVFEEVMVSFEGWYIYLVYPGVHISTAEAYKGVTPGETERCLKDILTNTDTSGWKNLVTNDFEPALFKKYPVLAEIKEKLYENGAFYASMTGSGSCIYGLFSKKPERLKFPSEYQCWSGLL